MDKLEEKNIFSKVYSNSQYKVEERERPDFIVSDINNIKIGVEITELYYNESQARTIKIPNYISDIIKSKGSEKSYKHKEDKNNLQYVEMYVKNKDGKYENFLDAVENIKTKKQKISAGTEYDLFIERIIEKIEEKNNKSEKYQKVDFLELIIKDMGNYFQFNKIDIEKIRNEKRIMDIISKSNFRNVYLITQLENEQIIIACGDIDNAKKVIENQC